jgi:lysozyme
MASKRKAAGWAAIAVVCVGGFEGLRQTAYRDPVGIPTVCFGETRGVRMGDHHTTDECKAMLAGRLEEFNDGVNRCVHVQMSDPRRAAVVSFSYNVGVGAFCKSSFARRLNAGDPDACDELLKWTKAKGITFPGLVRRREEERKLCMEG